MIATCQHCGKPESTHHAFEPVSGRPAGCVCYSPIEKYSPICDEYTGHNVWLYCIDCQHDEACHSGVAK